MLVLVAVDRVLFLFRLLHVDDVSGSLKDLLSPGLEVLDSQRPHLAGKSLHLLLIIIKQDKYLSQSHSFL